MMQVVFFERTYLQELAYAFAWRLYLKRYEHSRKRAKKGYQNDQMVLNCRLHQLYLSLGRDLTRRVFLTPEFIST